MPAQWTADVIGLMHLHEITAKQLAKSIGWNPKYLSQILNGRVTSKLAEEKVRAALQDLIGSQPNLTTPHNDA